MKRTRVRQRRLSVFIGSSREGLETARLLEASLADLAQVHVWTERFPLGDTTIDVLSRELAGHTHAVLVATGDDRTRLRDKWFTTARDNVVFEFGLFMGRLGRGRAFMLADHALKLPSDLSGLTIATFENGGSLKRAIRHIRRALQQDVIDQDVHVIQSLLTIVDPAKICLRSTYAEILRSRYHEIRNEATALRRRGNWSQLLHVKSLLREYFEFAGEYDTGAEFGESYVEALQNLGQRYEAAWSQVKDVGYMNILAGRHEAGRAAIAAVLRRRVWAEQRSPAEVALLLGYANRYLAVSYHRDPSSRDLGRALRLLQVAEKHAAVLSRTSKDWVALSARLLRNRGHIALDEGDTTRALGLYASSLELFLRLEDREHLASTRLAIARALNAEGGDETELGVHLSAAEAAYDLLGSVEGSAKVQVEYARYHLRRAREARTRQERRRHLGDALKATEKAKRAFAHVNGSQFRDDLDELERDLRRQLARTSQDRSAARSRPG
ncbi:MAG: nucleotide-binding protein [Polyangiaceae bacterium]|nr:nucleotide-binding protein [Polyangiaceae bacterium]